MKSIAENIMAVVVSFVIIIAVTITTIVKRKPAIKYARDDLR